MIPRTTSYTNRFKSADREHVEKLKQAYSDERADILARSRRLQQETNRRRKALAVKRKLEAAKEEKRRQEILNRRREEQKEATDRFQRLGKPREQWLADYHYKHPSRPSPGLEEALRTVSGRPSHFARQNSRETPVLEDALKVVRGSPNSHRHGPNGFVRQNSAQGDGTQARKDRPLSGSFRDRPASGCRQDRPNSGKFYSQSTMGPNYIQEHAREAATRAELQSHSLRQTSDSRSLFEQQLEQQQSLLLEQQKQSLHHFNTAIQKEMDKDVKLLGTEQDEILDPEREMNGKVARSDSLSSVDSLEMSNGIAGDSLIRPTNSQPTIPARPTISGDQNSSVGPPTSSTTQAFTYPTYVNSAWGNAPSVTGFNQPGSTNTSTVGGFVLHRSPSNPTNVAVVSPSVIQGRSESNNHDHSEKPNSTQGIGDVGSFTPNRDSRKEPSITGPGTKHINQEVNDGQMSNGHFESSPNSEILEPYNVIKTSSNGRANAHYYQDSVVNNASTFILHSHSKIPDQWDDTPKVAQQSNFDYSNPYSSKSSMTNVTVTSTYTPVTYNQKSVNSHSHISSYCAESSTVGRVTTTASSAAVKSTTIPTGFSHMAYLPHPPNTSAPSNRGAITMADMRASSLAGNVSANMKQFGEMNATEIDTNGIDDEACEEEDHEVQKPKQKVLKGILKKGKQPTAAGRGMRVHSATTYTAKLRAQGRGKNPSSPAGQPPNTMGTIRPSSSSSVRDSIEVARDQLSARKHVPKVKKRSIRWADMTYSDEEDEKEEELVKGLKETTNSYIQSQQQRKEPIINTQSKIPTTAASTLQKPRPYSAKFSTSTPKVEASVRESRVASAGPRRAPFIRPSIRNSLAASKAQTADYTKPNLMHNNPQAKPPFTNSSPSQVDTMNNSSYHTNNSSPKRSNVTSNKQQSSNIQQHQDKLSSSVTAADIRKSLEGAVYDANGIRLDRTPTDEEINWLWDKVRTCLSRQSTVDSNAGDNFSERSGSASVQSRQTAQVSNKYIDGTTLAPQFRTGTRTFANHNGNANQREGSAHNSTYLRKKISMDTLNTYNRRASSATQKKSPTINGYTLPNGSAYVNGNYPATYNVYGSNNTYLHNSQYQNPPQSNFGPAQSSSVANGYEEAISDSMAEFLTAEEMVSTKPGSVTDSQLQTAMDQRRNTFNTPNQTQRKGPSALSLEEQKLLQSLERLNERLKVIEDRDSGNHPNSTPAVFVPRPPQNRQGFKGHNPISQRKYSATSAATVSRHRFRTGSARIGTRAVSARYH